MASKFFNRNALAAIGRGSRDYNDVLKVWFGDFDPRAGGVRALYDAGSLAARGQLWYSGGPEFDSLLRTHTSTLVEEAIRGGSVVSSWEKHASNGSLALILLLDQFTRNIYRGKKEAFAGDARAIDVAKRAFDRNVLASGLPLEIAGFYMLPFEHSENLDDHRILHKMLDDHYPDEKEFKEFAIMHTSILEQFGRYPHRNDALGRSNSPEEIEYLKDGESFGQ